MKNQFLLGDADAIGKLRAHREGRLAARPHLRSSRRVRLHHAGMRFQIRLMRHLSRVSILDDEIGVPETLFDVALAPLEIRKHVARFFHRHRQAAVREQIGMKHRRAGFDRFQRIEQRLQLVILDFDQLQCLLGSRFGPRRHRGDLLADESDHAVRHHRRVVNAAPDPKSAHILSRDHRFHTRHLQCFAKIDAFDSSIRNRTAQAPTPQHVRQLQIGAVLRLPGNLEFALDSRCWLSHNLHHLLTSKKLNYDGLAAARSSLLNRNAPRCPAIRKNKHPTWQTGSIWLSFCLAVRRTQRTNCASLRQENSMAEPTIVCPHCMTEIKLTESLAAPLLETVRRDYEQRLTQKETDMVKREQALTESAQSLERAKAAFDQQVAE